MSLQDTLAEIYEAQLRKSPPALDAELAEHLDSVERLTLVVAIEDRFEICFEPEDEDQVHTLGDVLRLLETKLEA